MANRIGGSGQDLLMLAYVEPAKGRRPKQQFFYRFRISQLREMRACLTNQFADPKHPLTQAGYAAMSRRIDELVKAS